MICVLRYGAILKPPYCSLASSGKSWCVVFDMTGNAYEWTSTVNTASNGAESGTSVNMVKGGSCYATSSSGTSTGRGEGRSASGGYHSVGFRVAAGVQ